MQILLVYVTIFIVGNKSSHNASITASIMQFRPTKILMWQLIKEEREY
jgi:hypothetical protein